MENPLQAQRDIHPFILIVDMSFQDVMTLKPLAMCCYISIPVRFPGKILDHARKKRATKRLNK